MNRPETFNSDQAHGNPISAKPNTWLLKIYKGVLNFCWWVCASRISDSPFRRWTKAWNKCMLINNRSPELKKIKKIIRYPELKLWLELIWANFEVIFGLLSSVSEQFELLLSLFGLLLSFLAKIESWGSGVAFTGGWILRFEIKWRWKPSWFVVEPKINHNYGLLNVIHDSCFNQHVYFAYLYPPS